MKGHKMTFRILALVPVPFSETGNTKDRADLRWEEEDG